MDIQWLRTIATQHTDSENPEKICHANSLMDFQYIKHLIQSLTILSSHSVSYYKSSTVFCMAPPAFIYPVTVHCTRRTIVGRTILPRLMEPLISIFFCSGCYNQTIIILLPPLNTQHQRPTFHPTKRFLR